MNARPQQLHAVDVFAPWATDEERRLRRRIHNAGTIATARATREPNGSARSLYYTAAELAYRWVFRRVEKAGDLERILWGLNQIFLAADHVIQVEGPDVG